MPFRVKDVLIVDATVIIGLLILLTFQSISSSFVETEISAMHEDWREAQTDFVATWEFLEDCAELKRDGDAYEEVMENWLIDPGTQVNALENFTPEMKDALLEECTKSVVKINQQYYHLLTVEEQNYYKGYLSQYVGQKELSNFDVPPNDYDATLNWEATKESSYFKTIVTGPLWVNVANVLMIIPFTVSAVIASFNAFRKNEDTNKASRISVFAMGIGFISMIVGFIAILLAISVVYKPYI